ncbi:MAG: anaerobic ribonucleoside-triphosphate reductase activating protein [Anaerolineaceae bacterium]|nr:anaerobic ribonucleoside-triphosphate reductase activating protein [Anaerolineaceae bacterium]
MKPVDIDFIKGWVRTSLIDYPGKIATVIYTAGCNLRCPICHNPELINAPNRYDAITLSEIFDYLNRRKGVIDGIVITGGEPLFHVDMVSLLEQLRALPVAIKLDTNGCYPERLQEIIERKLVDMIAMDIKSSKPLYAQLTGVKMDNSKAIERSLTILKQSGISYEIRTTVIPGVIDRGVIAEIVNWIAPVQQYALQQFRPVITLDPNYRKLEPISDYELNEMLELARQCIPDVSVRGLIS